ncbi:MAG: nucleotidyltransferase family protein [Candidatus Scalindua sp.]
MMKKLEELRTILLYHKEDLKDEYAVNEIGIFGSYTKEEQIETSDIDILVDFQKAIDLLTFVHLKNHLSELLNVNVDLVMKKALKPNIGQRILREVVYI